MKRIKVIQLGIRGSMLRRGKCIDNASIETFFRHMENELNFNKIKNDEELIEIIYLSL